MRLCIYCASSAKIDPVYFEATRKLARILTEHDIEIVFGGGATGLMGILADTVLALDGKIKGIMPHFMNKVEWAHKKVTDFEFTETMHERKALLLKDADGLVALPGGSGTLEELLEAITLKRLGLFTKPIAILNTKGYYDPLREMLERAVAENFMHTKHLTMWDFVDQPEEILPALHNQSAWNQNAIHFAKQA